jgi:hypothetical protein
MLALPEHLLDVDDRDDFLSSHLRNRIHNVVLAARAR